MFRGTDWASDGELRGDKRVFRAFFNRRIQPDDFLLEYEASIAPGTEAGTFSDLSCHLGPVRFSFGSARNTFTGVRGPGQDRNPESAPLIEPGRSHRICLAVTGRDCRMQVDGQDAGWLLLEHPLEECAVELYCWSGPCEFRVLELRTGGRLPPVSGAPWIAEKERLHNMQQSIEWIEHKGKFLHECSLPGEGRDQGVYPAHPNGIQLSRDRFLVLYSTRASRGDDDEKSIVYQLREGGFDGRLVKEGWICRTRDDWAALGDGKQYVRQLGHATAFGVPKGALIQGRRQAHENLFAVIWRFEARYIDPQTGFMAYVQEHPELAEKTRGVEWMQLRLNDSGDDIEILQPPAPLRQTGYLEGPAFCRHESAASMVANFAQPVPHNADASEWVHADTIYVPGARGTTDHQSIKVHTEGAVIPLRFRYDQATHRYQWVETGPPFGGFGQGLFEGSIARDKSGWIMMARRVQGDAVAFGRVDDLFGPKIPMQLARDQPNGAPTVLYMCPDGILRRTGGLGRISPYNLERNPLYILDVDPDRGFACSNPRVIFDANRAGVPIPTTPIVDFGKLLPHAGGRSQTLLHRLRSPMLSDPRRPQYKLTPPEVRASGIYAAKIHYREEWPGTWEF